MPGWNALRSRVLREPLGLSYSVADFEAKREDRNLVSTIGGKVVAGLLIRATGQPDGVWKVRQFAVYPDQQGRGLGAQLMAVVENAACDENIAALILHSRETVTGFYEKLGFHAEGNIFQEVGIPHRMMRKSLPPQ